MRASREEGRENEAAMRPLIKQSEKNYSVYVVSEKAKYESGRASARISFELQSASHPTPRPKNINEWGFLQDA